MSDQAPDQLYNDFGKDLYRLAGGNSNSIPNILSGNARTNNSQNVETSGSDIGSGVSTDISQAVSGSVQSGKKLFDNTVAGYILGFDPKDGYAKFYIGNTTNYLNWTGTALNISGSLVASSIDIPDTTTANSFHVDSSGNMWLGATTFASAPGKVANTGAATFSNITITGGSITTTPISGIPNNSSTDISLLDLTHDLVFSVTDLDTVGWASGTITMSNGRTFSINSGNTGNMTLRTYIYLDTSASSTVLQTTTTVSTAMGANKKLIAVAQNGRAQAQFTVYDGIGGLKIPSASTGIENNNWGFSGTWSITDLDTIAWSSGTLTTSDGGSYSISAGNTGNMAAKTYVFFDLAFSSTVFNTTTTASSAVDVGKILIAICQNGTTEATFIVVNDKSLNIDAANIVAGSITANEIAAGTITAAKMNVTQLSAIAADLGTITAGSINIGSGNATIASTGNAVFKNVDIGVTNITIDNTGDIATQVAAISAAGGGVLHLKAGTYTVNVAVNIPSSVRIIGQSFSTTIIDFNNTAANFTLTGGNVYTTGTISSISGGVNVVGSGTTWTVAMIGRQIFINNRWYVIAAFTDTTHITLASGYADGATYSGTYRISSVVTDVSIEQLTFKRSTGTAIVCNDARQFNFAFLQFLNNNKGFTFTNCMETIVNATIVASSTSDGYAITNGSFHNFQQVASVSNGGNGATFTGFKSSGFLFCACDSNTADGFSITSCNNLDITVEASANGSQGFELVSGNDSILIHNGFYQNNTSDGIKLTASSSNCVIDDSNITGNGGYGINLAASTDNDNRIVNCHFATNTTANSNDSGTRTLFRANVGILDNSTSGPFSITEVCTAGEAITAGNAVYSVQTTNTHSANFVAASSQYFSAADSASLSITGSLTIEMWVKLASSPASGSSYTFVSKYLPTTTSYLVDYQNTAGVFSIRMINSADGTVTGSGSVNTTITVGTWTHVAVAYTGGGTTANVVINGVSVGTISGLKTSIFDSTADLDIGARNDPGPTPTAFLDGKIDDVRVWAAARTTAQIAGARNSELAGTETNLNAYWKLNNSTADSTANGNTLTNHNTVTFSTDTHLPTTTQPIVYKASAVDAASSDTFLGFANVTAAASADVAVVVGGVCAQLSGLSTAKQYYLSDTAGSVSTTAGTVTRKVGISLTAARILVTNLW